MKRTETLLCTRLALLLLLLIGCRLSAQAQTITFLNPSGQRVSSWKDGDRITVVVQGGTSARWVDIVRQTGYAGATPVPIYRSSYDPRIGLRYTFTAYYPGYVSISVLARTSSYGGYTTLNTLWKNQR